MSLGAIEDTRERRYHSATIRRRSYTEREKAAALEVLAANGGQLRLTAEQLGIAPVTLLDWKRQSESGPQDDAVEEFRPVVRKMLDRVFEEEAYAALAEAPDHRGDASYQQLITGAAICVDKMRLLREQATSIHAQQLSDEERLERLNELLATALTLPEQEQPALEAAAVQEGEEQDADADAALAP